MRSFFVQIFLSFWASTIAIFIAAVVFFPRNDFAWPENLITALRLSTEQMARSKLDASQTGGCKNLGSGSILVLDAGGREVCGTRIPGEQIQQLARRARATGHNESGRAGSLWVFALPFSERNSQYVGVLLSPYRKPAWFPHFPPFAIPVSALVTLIFAYLLTNPVRALRRAFRQFAAGDMSVRLPVSRNALRDWGGADIRTLMIDFNDMAGRIQALLEAHKTLLRDVSHELRSPLARLNVALELARDDASTANEALDRAELESSRLNTLIGELLSLSLMETMEHVPGSRVVSLSDVVDELMPDLMFEAEARHCRVVHRAERDCPVSGSEEVLRRALENVIRNAIRYSPANGEVEIETLTEIGEGQSTAVVRILDSGPGVPEESLKAIFRPFHRVDAARQTSTGGFGVGLAIADRAVQIHQGSIRAFNREGGGLCVELRLPCNIDERM